MFVVKWQLKCQTIYTLIHTLYPYIKVIVVVVLTDSFKTFTLMYEYTFVWEFDFLVV